MILKILSLLFISNISFGAAFQYGGIKHDITSQTGTASAIIMNSASTQVQRITGSTAQTLRLPDATTLRSGYWYRVVNENSSAVTIQNSSSFAIGTVSAGTRDAPTTAQLYLTSSSTSGGPWTVEQSSASSSAASDIYANDKMIYLERGSGHGSTNTKIRTYSRVLKNTAGSTITLTQSATLGDSFTVNTTGLYGICAGDADAGASAVIAITVNDSALTTSASTPITYAQGKRGYTNGATSSEPVAICTVQPLTDADIVRAHDDGANDSTSTNSYFYIAYLGDSSSYYYLENGAGYGSTNTRIRVYTNNRSSSGADISYTSDATNGDSFTINTDGIYWICRADKKTDGGMRGGIAVNDGGALATEIESLTYANGKRSIRQSATVGESVNPCAILKLVNTDVVRAHDSTVRLGNITDSTSYMEIVKLSGSQSFAYLESGATHGSVATKIRNFTNLRDSEITDLVSDRSTRQGASLTAYSPGMYGACYEDYSSGAAATAIAVNNKAPTTSASTPIEYIEGKRSLANKTTTTESSGVCAFDFLDINDYFSAVDDGANDGTNEYNSFMGARIN